ncbi:MAG TPA: hypothetical protein VEW46_05905 [Pyrinomonadaceae bacterium]|nr:hypothetical protein [Pyrinomonadaceae bacterium]
MLKSLIGDEVLAPMTEGQMVNSASEDKTRAEGINEVLLEISEQLASSHSLVSEGPSDQQHHLASEPDRPSLVVENKREARARRKTKKRPTAPAVKQRFGLPEGFVPRWQRYERGILLELNIYTLPDGREFLPCHPSGTLGAQRHLYALQSIEQYLTKKRGSVYVRNDGRIFDYSVDSGIPTGDIFDTGYTIYDLERTGRYAPSFEKKKKSREPAKYRRAANAG